jgi:ATP-binding cassette subfamily B protein
MELAERRGLINPFMQGISGLTVVVVIWYGGFRVVRGDLSIADVVAFIAYLHVLAWPTAAFGWMLSLVERGRAAMGRLEEVFEVVPEIQNPPAPATPRDGSAIEFRNVCFSHDHQGNGRWLLRDINFSLPQGHTLAIVGRTGSGKSTVIQLLPRLYDVQSGEVCFGGVDIRRFSLAELRRHLGYVPQDPFLFSTSLKRNLTFGRDGVSDEELGAVVRLARLDKDIAIFPRGLDTMVGERGITLSGGQKQRATLARALLADPPVLILDDCLSSVDSQTESEILRGLKGILKRKTCIIVSHRISAIKDADEILVVDDGNIVERGNHEELLRHGGVYAELYRQQQLSEELEQF